MKIVFRNKNKEEISFIISDSLSLRTSKNKNTINFKLRNLNYLNKGRIFKNLNLNDVNRVFIDDEEYNDLTYISDETYIHIPNKNEGVDFEVEDLSVTFERMI